MKNVNPMPGGCGYSKAISEKILSICEYPESIIELGCGNGGNLFEFKDSLVKIGIDPYDKNVEAAKRDILFSTSNVILGDHTKLKDFYNNEFDLGMTCSVLDHIEGFQVALTDMIRICKELTLFEPIKEGCNRQAKKGETSRWESTWYHDYKSYLETVPDIEFEIEHFPLYQSNSGPLYHFIHVKKI